MAEAVARCGDGQDSGSGCDAVSAARPPPRPSHSPPAEHYVFLLFIIKTFLPFIFYTKKNVLYFIIQKYLTFRLHEQAGAVEGVEGPPLPASCTAATAPTATPALLNH